MKAKEPMTVTAVEYDGSLYKNLHEAEKARARQEIQKLLPPRDHDRYPIGCGHYTECGQQQAIEAILKHPKEVAALFARINAAPND